MFRLLAASVLCTSTALAQGPPYQINGVHADVVVAYSGNNWVGNIQLDTALPQYNNQLNFTTNQAIIGVSAHPNSIVTQPVGNSAFNFIGAGQGNSFQRLSQNSLLPSQMFLGLNTEGMGDLSPGQGWANWSPAALSGNPGAPTATSQYVEYIIQNVQAPAGGHFSAWFTSGGVPRVYASTFERGFAPANESNSLFVPVDGHAHVNWGFTQPGTYNLEIVGRTFFINDLGQTEELRSPGAFTFQFNVAAVPEPVFLGLGLPLLLWFRRR
jgi:hypothetical protein